MEAIVKQVLRSPKARLYVDEMEAALRREETSRRQFREELRDGDKAEFINGKVLVHSPTKSEHLDVVLRTAQLLKTFTQVHAIGSVKSEKALVTLTRNDYEPDVCFWATEVSATFDPKQLHFPAPDLVVEVLSASTERIDRGIKLEDYAAHGTREYWILDPDARVAEQYLLRDGHYELLLKSSDGRLRSVAMSGLEVPVRALFDDAENLAALRRILAG